MPKSVEQVRSELDQLDARHFELEQKAEQLVKSYKAEGRDPLADRSAFEDVDKAYKAVEEVGEQIVEKKSELTATVAREGVPGSNNCPGTPGYRPPNEPAADERSSPLALDFASGELHRLHQAAVAGASGRVQAVTSNDMPPAGRTGYDLRIVPLAREFTRVADLIPAYATDRAVVTYYTGSTGASAGTVSEGATKPESAPTWSEEQATVRKIATWAQPTDEVLEDFDDALQVIGGDLAAALIATENDQLLNGDGTAPNLTGILNTAGIQTVVRDDANGESRLDALLRAVTTLRTGSSFVEPDRVVLHPDDFSDIRSMKDGQGNYLLQADPAVDAPLSIWGVPVTMTTDLAVGTCLLGNFAGGARLYARQAPTLETNRTPGNPQWSENRTLLRAEERIALAVTRPNNFVDVTL
jgi:HK97 family phage major capsid protein